MTSKPIPHNSLVVVADGVGARFFKNSGLDTSPALVLEQNFHPSDLMNDGPSGKRPPESSRQETDEATFAKQLAHELYRRAQRHEFECLVLIADPETLGQIRPILHKEVTDRLSFDLAKTLTSASIDDIQSALQRAQ